MKASIPNALTDLGAHEIRDGLWRWTAFHRQWKKEVGCLAIPGTDGLVLVDPLLPEEQETEWLKLLRSGARAGGGIAVVLTVFFHRRSAGLIAEKVGRVELWAEEGGRRRLKKEPVTHHFRMGDPLPGGLVAFPTARPGEVVLWHPRGRAVIAGDALLGGKRESLRMCPSGWLPRGVGRPALARSLASLLYLPVEAVVVSHGDPVMEDGPAALEAALSVPLPSG